VIKEAVSYIKTRTSKKVNYKLNLPHGDVLVPLNIELFEWVIENLCKNAVDAMAGEGILEIDLFEESKHVIIDFSDTGKGIPKSKFKTVFTPGFTSKKTGWGLGLTLSQRIIQNYHSGKIFVRSSTVNKGTTFRIIMKK
jgi:signal transduction histidine kinase